VHLGFSHFREPGGGYAQESIRHSPKSETLAKLLKVIVLGNLVTPTLQVHTRITYHRTWETGLEVAARAAITNPDFFARFLPNRSVSRNSGNNPVAQ
jgi:hypothetical protein